MQTLTLQSVSKLLKRTYQSKSKTQIDNASQMLLILSQEQPLKFMEVLVAIIESPIEEKMQSSMPLRDSASIHLKNTIYKYIWFLESNQDKDKDPVLLLLTQKLYIILNTPAFLSTASIGMLSSSLASICKYNKTISNDLTSQFLKDMATSNDPFIMRSLKEVYVSIMKNKDTLQEMTSFIDVSLSIIKHIFVRFYEQIRQPQKTSSALKIIQDFFNLLDSTFQTITESQEQFGPILHRLKQDLQLTSIFIKYLEIGYAELNSIVLNEKITPYFQKINSIKEIVFETMEKIYVIDPAPVINLCIRTVLNCEGNSFATEKRSTQQLYTRCLCLLNKNADFNQNYIFFNMNLVHLLTKCMILCKSTQEQLMMIEDQPENFIQNTEDFCDRRQEYSIRMKAAELIKILVKKIDGAMAFLKSICYDLIRDAYSSTKLRYDIKDSQIYQASKVVKVQISLLILAVIYSQIKSSQQSQIQMRAFLLEMIQPFNQEVQPLIQLRLINLIGYCNDFNYLQLVTTRMQQKPDALKYQAFSTLNRILRQGNLQPVLYRVFSEIFTQQIQLLDVQSYLFQTIILNNYQKLLGDYPKLKQVCIQKVINAMVKVISHYQTDTKQHIPFNLFSSMVSLETNLQIVQEMENKFILVLRFPNRRQTTQSNVLQIMTLFLNRIQKANQVHLDFMTFIQQNLYEYYEDRETFLYMNSFVYWSDTTHELYKCMNTFISIKMMGKDNFMTPIAFIMGQIVYKHPRMSDFQSLVKQAINYYPQCQLEITKGRLLNVVLQAIMSNPLTTLNLLGQSEYLRQINQIVLHTNYFIQPIDRKICIIGICKILQMEAVKNRRSNMDLLMVAVKFLGIQYNKTSSKQAPIYFSSPTDPDNQMQQQGNQQQQSQNQAIFNVNKMVAFDSDFYKKFLHPIDSVDQFLVFNQLWQEIKQLYIDKLNTKQTKSIRALLEVKKIQQKTRRIVKVKYS